MTPRRHSLGPSWSRRLAAPRSLKEPVIWRFSSFTQQCVSVIEESVRDSAHGVCSTIPASRARAASMAARSGPFKTGGAGLAASSSPCHNPAALQAASALARLAAEIVRCRRCPRLVAHREASGANPPRRYRDETYWARPLPGFGDPRARLLLVGLAPAAHGGNRTGRMFTGDQSGAWLFAALHAAGFANQPASMHRADGLALKDAWVTAALRCAPPANKPAPDELARCQPFLLTELRTLSRVRVVVALGRIGWDNYLRARRVLGWPPPIDRPVFGHGATTRFADGTTPVGSYDPTQQHTFTASLTPPMLNAIFMKARELLESSPD